MTDVYSQWKPDGGAFGCLDFSVGNPEGDAGIVGTIGGHGTIDVTVSDLRSLRDHVSSLIARYEAQLDFNVDEPAMIRALDENGVLVATGDIVLGEWRVAFWADGSVPAEEIKRRLCAAFAE